MLFVLHQYIGAADQLAPIYWCCKNYKKSAKFFNSQNVRLFVLLAQFHQYIAATMSVAPIYWWN
jgi:hypothetical protein